MEDNEFQSFNANEYIINANEQKAKMETNSQPEKEQKKNNNTANFVFSFEVLSLLCAVCSIVFSVFVRMFAVINSLVMMKILVWFAGLMLIASFVLYVLDCIKSNSLKIEKKQIFMLVAVAFFIF